MKKQLLSPITFEADGVLEVIRDALAHKGIAHVWRSYGEVVYLSGENVVARNGRKLGVQLIETFSWAYQESLLSHRFRRVKAHSERVDLYGWQANGNVEASFDVAKMLCIEGKTTKESIQNLGELERFLVRVVYAMQKHQGKGYLSVFNDRTPNNRTAATVKFRVLDREGGTSSDSAAVAAESADLERAIADSPLLTRFFTEVAFSLNKMGRWSVQHVRMSDLMVLPLLR